MVGGLWRIDNDSGLVAAYKTLHLNSSRPLTQFPSYPMPEDWPDYPPHALVAQYFQRFAEDNHLLERITFRTEVTGVESRSPSSGPRTRPSCASPRAGLRTAGCPSPTTACCTPTPRSRPSCTTGSATGTSR